MLHETIYLTVPDADGAAELTAYAPGASPELGEGQIGRASCRERVCTDV